MSQDPFGYPSDVPPPGSTGAPGTPDVSAAKGRVLAPAIGLIIVGVVNLLLGLGGFGLGATFKAMPPDQFEAMMRQQNPQQWEQMQRQGWSGQAFLNMYVYSGFGTGCMGL